MSRNKLEDYDGFVEKFVPKKTTDDCYTPANVYEVVASYVTETYGVNRSDMVRPFWPGADYQGFTYPEACCVVDNPPFSIVTKICSWYFEHGIRFFLFCPHLTGGSLWKGSGGMSTLVIAPATVTYENGAVIETSFVTNLEPGTALRTDPDLAERIKKANEEYLQETKKELPKYIYPSDVLTAAAAGKLAKYGVSFRLASSDCAFIRRLESQIPAGKAIYGGGFLLSERAAAERAASTFWELSPKERALQATLGRAER